MLTIPVPSQIVQNKTESPYAGLYRIPETAYVFLSHLNPLKSSQRQSLVILKAQELYDDMRWYHGTSALSKNNIEAIPEKEQPGGFAAPVKGIKIVSQTPQHIYASQDFLLAGEFAWKSNRRPVAGGIVRIIGTAEELGLESYGSFYDKRAKNVKRTLQRPAHKNILTQVESAEIKALFYKHMKNKIPDITQNESDMGLRRVRSFDQYDRDRWMTLKK